MGNAVGERNRKHTLSGDEGTYLRMELNLLYFSKEYSEYDVDVIVVVLDKLFCEDVKVCYRD
jgi:hypothetical protein